MRKVSITGDPLKRRSREYMPAGDQLDAIAKAFRALQQQGFLFPDETVAWLDHCEAVKARLPKRR